MLSLLLVTAMSAVADTPRAQTAPPAKVANRANYASAYDTYYGPSTYYSYSPPQFGFGGGGCGCGNPYYCPTDDVFLDLPCLPCAPCPITPVRPVAAPRVNVFTPPPPIRYCPRTVPCCP